MTNKLADTQQIKRINKTKGNRRITDEGVYQLDPHGKHVLAPVMVHNDTDYRCLAFLKFVGQNEPVRVYLDVPLKHFEALSSIEEE